MRNMSGETSIRTVKIEIGSGKDAETITIEFNPKNARITSSNGSAKTFNLEYYWERKAYATIVKILIQDIREFLGINDLVGIEEGGEEGC